MRRPNGSGTVYRMKDYKDKDGKIRKRRKPWIAKVTVGYEVDKVEKKYRQKYFIVGTFATRKEAMDALATYSITRGYELKSVSFAKCYELWSEKKYQNLSDLAAQKFRLSFDRCSLLHNKPIWDITIPELQAELDKQTSHTGMSNLRGLFYAVFEYGYSQGMVSLDIKDRLKYLTLDNAPEAVKQPHRRIPNDKVKEIWDAGADIALMLIYSGCRPGELVDLRKENVHLDEQYFSIIKSKTENGIRDVPIADKVLPFWQAYMENTKGDYLLPYKQFDRFRYNWWKKQKVLDGYTPHDCRHTCNSLLDEAGVDDRIVKTILGHSRRNMGDVYSHISMPVLLEAINKI